MSNVELHYSTGDSKHPDMCYHGNVLLKAANVIMHMTEEEVEEYVKCATDPIYFAEKYFHIVSLDEGWQLIALYDFQKDVINTSLRTRRVVVNTSRQVGKTTVASIIILHYALFSDEGHKRIGIVANKEDNAMEVLDRVKRAYEAMPWFLQVGVKEWNKKRVEFDNGSVIIAGASGAASIRGKSVNMLYIDEVSHVENWHEFSSSVLPTISSGKTTKLLYTSTPKGLNHFYKTCVGAMKDKDGNAVPNGQLGRNGFAYFEVPYWVVPGRDDEFVENAKAECDYDEDKFAQEYCCEFLGSSGTLITGKKLKELVPLDPIEQTEDGLLMYVRPRSERKYACTVDVSRGKGMDYHAFNIIDITQMPYRQVCVFKNNLLTPVEYTDVLYRIAKMYNEAVVLVEINDIGGQVADLLYFDYEYENILYTENAGRAGKKISLGFSKSVDRGIRTTRATKTLGCSLLKMLIEQDQLIINDYNTIHELSVFSKKGKSYEAEEGEHDDIVMTLLIFAWLSNDKYFRELTDNATLLRLREKSEEQIAEELVPFGVIAESGRDEEEDDTSFKEFFGRTGEVLEVSEYDGFVDADDLW